MPSRRRRERAQELTVEDRLWIRLVIRGAMDPRLSRYEQRKRQRDVIRVWREEQEVYREAE